MKNAILILIIVAIAYTLLSQKKKATVQVTGWGPLSFQNIFNSLFAGTSNGKKAEDTQQYKTPDWVDQLSPADRAFYERTGTLSA